jgi:hypothetical protein
MTQSTLWTINNLIKSTLELKFALHWEQFVRSRRFQAIRSVVTGAVHAPRDRERVEFLAIRVRVVLEEIELSVLSRGIRPPVV